MKVHQLRAKASYKTQQECRRFLALCYFQKFQELIRIDS